MSLQINKAKVFTESLPGIDIATHAQFMYTYASQKFTFNSLIITIAE